MGRCAPSGKGCKRLLVQWTGVWSEIPHRRRGNHQLPLAHSSGPPALVPAHSVKCPTPASLLTFQAGPSSSLYRQMLGQRCGAGGRRRQQHQRHGSPASILGHGSRVFPAWLEAFRASKMFHLTKYLYKSTWHLVRDGQAKARLARCKLVSG